MQNRLDILEKYNLKVWTIISNHLLGQAVCDDPIDQRHQAILPAHIWVTAIPRASGSGRPRRWATTARAARRLGVDVVVGFTGSSIWKTIAMFPPVPQAMIDAGYADFADRWNPILDVFDEAGVKFAYEAPWLIATTTGRPPQRWRRSGIMPCRT